MFPRMRWIVLAEAVPIGRFDVLINLHDEFPGFTGAQVKLRCRAISAIVEKSMSQQ